ncbi:hypothetical protein POM88_012801 [Heracleum sosnowskyi]|uniref:Replication factor A C-terminal domain-containing protein n=1 Tax=Heracleum sosnowskyi TaxID=360622 RepID=A0AAD8J103_9APIA|nr:hypothetical protein POM88_012801 [Heracleum sosnowskyi]
MMQASEKPVIVIISCCRIGKWNNEVDICNVGATKYYLNYKHHSVVQLRKMLKMPEIAAQIMESQPKKKIELLKIANIKNLGSEYIENQVLTHVKIDSVEDNEKWYYNICTTCELECRFDNGFFVCDDCQRIVPHPDKRYKIKALASDTTGGIEIVMEDREVRNLIGLRARNLFNQQKQVKKEDTFPICLKNIGMKDYTVVLRIKQMNVVDKINVFWATNICPNFIKPDMSTDEEICDTQSSNSQATTSTYHLQGMSDLNFQST